MALGVFIGLYSHHSLPYGGSFDPGRPPESVSRLPPLSGIQIGNPLTIPAIYLAAYKVGQFLLYRGKPLVFPETFSFKAWICVLWQGGVALQVGGVIIAIPPAVAAYFLTLWIVQRYHRRKAQKALSVLRLSQNPPAASGPEA